MDEKNMETSVDFTYETIITKVQCNLNETINVICHKFLIKSNLNQNSVYFLLSGNKIDENMRQLTLGELMKQKNTDSFNILVQPMDMPAPEEEKELVKSKYIICPKCNENTKIKINDYKIYLYDCKNDHKIGNILLDEFDNTQNIDIAKIICDECKNTSKSKSYKKEFYICVKCNKKLCPLCRKKHDGGDHIVINFNEKDFKCKKHGDSLVKYCNDCKENICLICNEHNNHKNEFYIMPEIGKIKERMEQIRNELNEFNDIIKARIDNLNEIPYKTIYS